MNTSNQVLIRGDREHIYRLASQVERWPDILPHYRAVDILDGDSRSRTVRMRCFRRFGPVNWPCQWLAEQELDPEAGKIRYRHLAGPAKGMRVEWSLECCGDSVRTTITHLFEPRIPIFGSIYSDRIVGPLFVSRIAGQTLETIKRYVEGEK
ncbi:MAG TPA: SRPBCC family protein [Fimbriimonas sp.]